MPFQDPWSIRTDALAIAREACPDGDGTQMGEEPFETVTEHRQSESEARRRRGSPEVPYSSCGDLGHHTLEQLLAKHLPHPTPAELAEAYKTINHGSRYTPGLNVNKLYMSPAFVHHRKGGSFDAQQGDVVIIGEGGSEHVLVVEYAPDDPTAAQPCEVPSRDYGQLWSRKDAKGRDLPANFGGRQRVRQLTRGADGRLYLGAGAPGTIQGPRPVLGYLDVWDWLSRVLRAE